MISYIQNPNQSACSLLPKACRANGSILNRSLAEVINYFAQKLQAPGVITVAGNFEDANGISLAYSSADLTSANFLPANTPIPIDSQYDYPPVYTPPSQLPPLPQQPSILPQTLPQPITNNTLSAQPTTPTQPATPAPTQTQTFSGSSATNTNVPPAALIIVQPSIVTLGNPILVAWTSVGMSSVNACVVSEGTTILAQSNEGSKILPTIASTSQDATFALLCTSQSGQTIEQTASVTID